MDQEHPVPLKLTCEDVIAMLLEYLEARLDTSALAAFERHLAVCPPCIAYLNTYRRTRELTAASGRVDMPDEMKTRIREFLLRLT
jgi:anti-sigma factor (TIGR02949 family)